jgi:hypothetical protein
MFPYPLFLEYLFFFVFFTYLMSLKNNKIMLHYKGEMSVARKQTSPKRMEDIDSQLKKTCAG